MRKLFILLNVMLSPIILSASNFSPTNGVLINNNLGNSENIRNLQGAGTVSSSPSSIITPIGTISASPTRAVGTLSATNTRRAAGTQSATVTRSRAIGTATATATRSRAIGTATATVTRSRAIGTATATATRSRAVGTPTVTATRSRVAGTQSATVTATRTRAVGTPSATVTATRSRAVGTPSGTVTRTATRSRAGGSPSGTNTGTVTPTRTETMTLTDTKTGTPTATPSITSSQVVGTISNTATPTATSSTQLAPFLILIQGKQVLGYYNMILSSLQNFAGSSSIIQITSINWLNDVFAVAGSSNQAQLIKTQYESSIQYQQLEFILNPATAVQSPAVTATQQSIALPVGIGVGGLVAVALIGFGIIIYIKQNNKKRRLISGSNEQEKKNTIQPQHIAINYNDTHDSQTAQKVINPFQRRNSIGILEYEPVTVEQRPQSIRNMDIKQTFPPTKTNIFKPIDNTRTKMFAKSISVYPPPPLHELPPPPPFNPDREDERLPE